MRILFSVHLYPPAHNCGGEYYIHNMAKWLISQGHQCRVLLHQGKNYGITEIYTYQGVEVFPVTGVNGVQMGLMNWCSIVITHLEYTQWTVEMSRIYKKPAVQIVHNDTPYDAVLGAQKPINIIYNSQWIADKLKYKHHSMTLVPPVDYRHYDLRKNPIDNRYITLINCNENKGGKVLGEIARLMPDRLFLAVKGSYEEQFIDDLPNIHIRENSPDILPVYADTRILIMPSEYESWGMTATEAMCNGIPVICAPTPGLKENTAGKMLYCDRTQPAEWVEAIRKLDKATTYKWYSNAARKRSRELDPLEAYKKLEQFLYVAV